MATEPGKIVAWAHVICTDIKELRDLASLWRFFKSAMANVPGPDDLNESPITLRSVPERCRLNLPEVVKPLTDALVSASALAERRMTKFVRGRAQRLWQPKQDGTTERGVDSFVYSMAALSGVQASGISVGGKCIDHLIHLFSHILVRIARV